MLRINFRICLIFLPALLLVARPAWRVSAQEATPIPPQVAIRSPLGGEALQGMVTIQGVIAVDGFRSAELAFAYAGRSDATWFLIGESSEPISEGALFQWDTTTITDGDYDLRLSVILADGTRLSALVAGLRVRNYTSIEPSTPTPVTPTATLELGETPTPTPSETPAPTSTPRPTTPTPLPTNPADLPTSMMVSALGKGALAVLGLFALMGVYALVRAMLHHD